MRSTGMGVMLANGNGHVLRVHLFASHKAVAARI
jgi:hypothetical protein